MEGDFSAEGSSCEFTIIGMSQLEPCAYLSTLVKHPLILALLSFVLQSRI